MSKPEDSESEENGVEAGTEGGRLAGGPFAVIFPPDQAIWNESRRLVADKTIRVDDLAVCCSQDPVIVIELLRVSNAMFFAGGRSPITSTKTAITRLGSDVVMTTLEKLKERQLIENPEVLKQFEVYRSRGRRTAIVARILAEALARQLADDCQACGLLSYIGDMLAVAYFREEYVTLATENSRSSVNFRLVQDRKFDVEAMGINYLRRQGIPEALLFALERESRPPKPDRAIMKPLHFAACELVDAFDANRWEKLAPGKTLPPKSTIRLLGMNDAQYLKIYERASEYLFAARLLEEKQRRDGGAATFEFPSEAAPPISTDQDALDSEIKNILKGGAAAAPTPEPAESDQEETPPSTEIKAVPEKISSPQHDPFNLKNSAEKPKTIPRVARPAPIKPPPPIHTEKANKLVGNLTKGFDNAKTSEELLSDLLRTLVDDGPFEKSAIIVVSGDRKEAIVVAARGPRIGNGQRLTLDDPLSPLAQCFSKVRSFSTRDNGCSPWGSKNFALAPIDADHGTPVALYADCGDEGGLTFEARRVFRTVVEILNQKLPQLPGGIPVELKQ